MQSAFLKILTTLGKRNK